ncbi:FAD-dependent thymidylate synthase, partial [Candidatus Magnetobacterium casense]
MKLVLPSFEILSMPSREESLRLIELAGRTAYKSEDKITAESAPRFVRMLMGRNHQSVIEHVSATVKLTVDRGVSHEAVRHRIASFTQTSTRYVNYGRQGIEFIIPPWLMGTVPEGQMDQTKARLYRGACHCWLVSLLEAESDYNSLLAEGWQPQQARDVLPNALKTEIVVTANFREWAHIFELRCSPAAHPAMRSIMTQVRERFQQALPEV